MKRVISILIICLLLAGLLGSIPVSASNPKPSETGNDNNFLDSLTVYGFSLSPSFSRYTMEYAVEITEETTSITIAATANSSDAVVSGIGTIQLYAGENLIPITVTAANGAVRIYTLSVYCEAKVSEKPDNPLFPSETTTGKSNTTQNTTRRTNAMASATTPTATAPTESTTTTSTTKPHTTTGKSDTTQNTTRQTNAMASVSDDPTAGADTSGATDNEDTPAVTKPHQTTRASSASKETTDNGSVGKTIAIAGLLITIVCVAVGITAIVKHKYDT